MNLVNVNAPKVLWAGVTTRKLGLVEPSGNLNVNFQLVSHAEGLQVIKRFFHFIIVKTFLRY